MANYLRIVALKLVTTLTTLHEPRLLSFRGWGKNLLDDKSRLITYFNDDAQDVVDRITPLLITVLRGDCDDTRIWNQVYRAVTEETPPPPLPVPILPCFQQKPWSRNTSSFKNSSEYLRDVNRVLREELGTIYVGLPRFHGVFFGDVAGLGAASEAVFDKCQEGDSLLFGPRYG
ncbi:hypothetical protein T069G_01556 [Trichoderma breve]|uniref:Uncharacterized protein n=1 Tax=Trichoderma breve TaxID=2034170 RepID=A0A9W9EEC3_9HYPO|nr:hypothetical protein T069G_01556 [Trichoderma breve]KAJ4865026.1 hypothetical protein T069G_01556 [Trichoderma breve]